MSNGVEVIACQPGNQHGYPVSPVPIGGDALGHGLNERSVSFLLWPIEPPMDRPTALETDPHDQSCNTTTPGVTAYSNGLVGILDGADNIFGQE